MSSRKEQKDSEPSVIKVDKWDATAVKNALDDAVKNTLIKKYNYIENFALFDGRLLLSSVAFIVALIAMAWDYVYPFPASKPVLLVCVSIYFIIMGLSTLYAAYIEKGIFAVAIQRDPAGFDPDYIWEASSDMKKHDDKYTLVLSVKNEATGAVKSCSISKSVANFIDINGVVIQELIEAAVAEMHDSLTSQRKDK